MENTNEIVVSDICESMDRFGYAVGNQMLDIELLRAIARRVPDYYKRDHIRFGKDFLNKINEAEVVRNVIEYDEIFIELLEQGRIIDGIIQKLLHPWAIIHNYNLITLFPEFKTNMLGHSWHRDVFYFGPGIRTSVVLLIPLLDTSDDNGATKLIPGSHLVKEMPSDKLINISAVSANLKLGDVLFVDAATFHCAGVNTAETARTIISIKYTLSFFTQQYDICRAINVEKYSPLIRERLGYNVRVPASIEEFRVESDSRTYKSPLRK
jgi:ectoine hydroxylase-related dioxygenase (phytanoyl-CoA dioxygenase family)